ncbi:hypothetical protein [Xanthomonas euvesicatoria]|uniref:DUF805 domain-containing protein n=1 Tax=Xanthomonas euvesicatoria TaxID=456327 RepID=A0AAW3U6U8_XANEU|nr:hypothetical protein [Xanthomonas euvesicatoria]MBB4724755.1 hypothetical protein [Xanthomonas euvesicatoria]MBB4871552.1 hypothetical protein [Xanthomonas euvesicatoria]
MSKLRKSTVIFLWELIKIMVPSRVGLVRGGSCKDVSNVQGRLSGLERRIKKLEEINASPSGKQDAFWPSIFISYLLVLSGIMAVGTAVLFVKGGVAEYLSYISPLIAAIIGGAGAYFSERRAGVKGVSKAGKVFSVEIVCYFSSIGIGGLGLVAFFAYKGVVGDLAVAMVVPFAFMLSFFIFLIRLRKDGVKKLGGRSWLFPSFMLLVICAGLAYCWLEFVIGGQMAVSDAAASAAAATKNEAKPK